MGNKTGEYGRNKALLKYLGIKEDRGLYGRGYNTKEPRIETIYQDLLSIGSPKRSHFRLGYEQLATANPFADCARM